MYWGSVQAMSEQDDAAGETPRPPPPARTAAEAPSPSGAAGEKVHRIEDMAVLDELDVPLWLLDVSENENLWANRAALELFGASLADFLDPDFYENVEDAGNTNNARFTEEFRRHAMKVVENASAGGHRRSAPTSSAPRTDHLQCPIPGLSTDSPHYEQLFNIACQPFSIDTGSFLGGGQAQGATSRGVKWACLVRAEPFNASFTTSRQSLRALEMLKSSPIIWFLFSRDGGTCFMANPRALEFYHRRFNDVHEELTLPRVLSCGIWDESATFPDGDPMIAADKEIPEKVADLCRHVERVLFAERSTESYRMHVQMPRFSSPGSTKWVEFEMWSIKDPVTHCPAILVNQTNMHKTKKMEIELKNKHAQLKSYNELLQQELKKAKESEGPKIDLDSTVDKAIILLNNFMDGKKPSLRDVEVLKTSLETSKNLRAPSKLEEMLMSNTKHFGGEVGLSLLGLLCPKDESPGTGMKQASSMKDRMALSSSYSRAQEKGQSIPAQDMKEKVDPLLKQLESSAPLREFLETIDDFFFDAFELERVSGGHPLCTISFHIMTRLNLLETFSIDPKQLFAFLLKIEEGYPQNAYHNRTHAANVVQSMFILLTQGMGPDFAGDLEMMAGLLSAIVHDFEHKGVNNDFLIRYQDELALKYNDKSPLENHHVAAAFNLILMEPFQIFANLSIDQFSKIRKLMIEMVIATDMKLHFEILGRFRLLESKISRRAEGYDTHQTKTIQTDFTGGLSSSMDVGTSNAVKEMNILLPEDVALSLQVALKCADVGHVYCSPNVHMKWVQKLEQELFAQGDKEKEHGAVTTSPLMDREKGGITKSQCGFFQIVVLPLFKSFSAAFGSISPLTESVLRNLELWRRIEEDELEPSELFG